jgi:aryl-alcohol dehydrogenase-like predicted oxidoreductase
MHLASNERDSQLSISVSEAEPFREILGLKTLPLGFGTGALFSKRRSHRDALKLIETALDSGITYFDTARMYGSGRAEGVIGEIAARNRDRLILVSKAGIFPQSRSLLVRAAGQGVRLLHRTVPSSKEYVSVPRTYLPQFGFFKLADIRKSVEISLRELRTDYLDILLLHECNVSNFDNQELRRYLGELKAEGKIRAFGIATSMAETEAILAKYARVPDVVQIPSAIWNMNIRKLQSKYSGFAVTHSSLSGRLNVLLARLTSDEAMAAEWREMTDTDPNDTQSFTQLLLAHAVDSNRAGIVIFFSSNPANILANVNSIKRHSIYQAQIDGLNRLASSSHVAAFFDSAFRNLNF